MPGGISSGVPYKGAVENLDLGSHSILAAAAKTTGNISILADNSFLEIGAGNGSTGDARLYYDGTHNWIILKTAVQDATKRPLLVNGDLFTSVTTEGIGVLVSANGTPFEFQCSSSGSSPNSAQILMSAASSGFAALAAIKMGHAIGSGNRDTYMALCTREASSGAAVEHFRVGANGDFKFTAPTDADLVFSFTATTNSGSMKWMEDENYFEFMNTVKINSLLKLTPGSAPSSPSEGDVYANSADHHLYYYNGTIWKQLDN